MDEILPFILRALLLRTRDLIGTVQARECWYYCFHIVLPLSQIRLALLLPTLCESFVLFE